MYFIEFSCVRLFHSVVKTSFGLKVTSLDLGHRIGHLEVGLASPAAQ
jgi:hypothetical protein